MDSRAKNSPRYGRSPGPSQSRRRIGDRSARAIPRRDRNPHLGCLDRLRIPVCSAPFEYRAPRTDERPDGFRVREPPSSCERWPSQTDTAGQNRSAAWGSTKRSTDRPPTGRRDQLHACRRPREPASKIADNQVAENRRIPPARPANGAVGAPVGKPQDRRQKQQSQGRSLSASSRRLCRPGGGAHRWPHPGAAPPASRPRPSMAPEIQRPPRRHGSRSTTSKQAPSHITAAPGRPAIRGRQPRSKSDALDDNPTPVARHDPDTVAEIAAGCGGHGSIA